MIEVFDKDITPEILSSKENCNLIKVVIDGKEQIQDIKLRGEGNAAIFFDESIQNIVAIELIGVTKSMRFLGVCRNGD